MNKQQQDEDKNLQSKKSPSPPVAENKNVGPDDKLTPYTIQSDISSQVTMLKRLNPAQQQSLARNISSTQGNRHVQRLMEAYTVKGPLEKKKTSVLQLKEKPSPEEIEEEEPFASDGEKATHLGVDYEEILTTQPQTTKSSLIRGFKRGWNRLLKRIVKGTAREVGWLGGKVLNTSDTSWLISGRTNREIQDFFWLAPGKNSDNIPEIKWQLDGDVDFVWPYGTPIKNGHIGEIVDDGAFKLLDYHETKITGNEKEGYTITNFFKYCKNPSSSEERASLPSSLKKSK